MSGIVVNGSSNVVGSTSSTALSSSQSSLSISAATTDPASLSPNGSTAASSTISTDAAGLPITSTPTTSSGASNGTNGQCAHIPSFSSISIAPTGSGSEYAHACMSNIWNWFSAQGMGGGDVETTIWHPLSIPGTTGTVSDWTVTSTLPPPSSAYTTICDGFPRVTANYTPQTTILSDELYTVTATVSSTAEVTKLPVCSGDATSAPGPMPTCSFPDSDCTLVHDFFATRGTFNPLMTCLEAIPDSFQTCTIAASSVQLYYWPTTTTGSPSCDGTNGETWATVAPPVGRRVATITLDSVSGVANSSNNTIVMTSPSVYLAINGISATKVYNGAFQSRVGSVGSASIATTIISMAPENLQSVEEHISGFSGPWQSELSLIISGQGPEASSTAGALNFTQIAKPYNLFNLQRPVPASDYFFRAT
ncbi:MAG: hypothetical protein Q9162_000386, partial [Coniocarpon cinnabarinum]